MGAEDMTEDDLNYYFFLVDTLWVSGISPTFEQIRDRVRPPVSSAQLNEGLAILAERRWVKLQQVPIGAWSAEVLYETWYVPIREHP